MSAQCARLPLEYVGAVNRRDAAAYLGLFAQDATVDDAGRTFHGHDEIKRWADADIFAAHVSFEVLDAELEDDRATITTKVDGTFDRTGLPDPVVISHHLEFAGEAISKLACRLVEPATNK